MKTLLSKEQKIEELKASSETNPLIKVAELNEHIEKLDRRVFMDLFIGETRLFKDFSLLGCCGELEIVHGPTATAVMREIGNGWYPSDTKHLRVKDLPLTKFELV